jgi:hypothetical protein
MYTAGDIVISYKIMWRLLNKLKLELLYNKVNSTFTYKSKRTEMGSQRNTCTPMFTAALFLIAGGGRSSSTSDEQRCVV